MGKPRRSRSLSPPLLCSNPLCGNYAPSLELDAAVDEHGRGVDVAVEPAGGVNLDGSLRANIPMDGPTPDDDRRDVNLGVHLGAVADDERVVALDLALEGPVDTYSTLEVQLAFEVRAATQEGGDFGGGERGIHGGPLSGDREIAQPSPEDLPRG